MNHEKESNASKPEVNETPRLRVKTALRGGPDPAPVGTGTGPKEPPPK